jgi:hypothetical protein
LVPQSTTSQKPSNPKKKREKKSSFGSIGFQSVVTDDRRQRLSAKSISKQKPFLKSSQSTVELNKQNFTTHKHYDTTGSKDTVLASEIRSLLKGYHTNNSNNVSKTPNILDDPMKITKKNSNSLYLLKQSKNELDRQYKEFIGKG